jgi:hypothetical protein
MFARAVPGRLAAALISAAALAACGGSVNFEVSKTFAVDTGSGSTSWSGEQLVDLRAEARDAWDQRSKLDTIEVKGASAVIDDLGFNHASASGSGTVSFRPDGATDASQDVLVGSWSNVPFGVGQQITLTPSSQLDDFVTSAFKKTGRFTVVASGQTDDGQRADFTFTATVRFRLKWKLI